MISAKLKWGSQRFDVTIDPTKSISEFKSALEKLTSVPVDRQRIMSKGWRGVLKDDMDASKIKLVEGMTIKLVGTADVMSVISKPIVFKEDLSTSEVAELGDVVPSGLINLGNTCYANATIQCLRNIPELKELLKNYTGVDPLVIAMKEMYASLDRSKDAMTPTRFLALVKQMNPIFAETSPQGFPKQQDADEFFGFVTTHLQNNLPGFTDLFAFELEVKTSCLENPDEEPTIGVEKAMKLVCNITGGAGSTKQVNHLHQGLELHMNGTLTKRSPTLERDAEYKIERRIKNFPKYFCVQLLRFCFINNNATKILRPVQTPLSGFDMFDSCNEELKTSLRVNRDKEADEAVAGLKAEAKAKEEEKKEEEMIPELEGIDDPELIAAIRMSLREDADEDMDVDDTTEKTPVSMGVGIPSTFQGHYDLIGVVTHKGRSVNSGHYMGWTRKDGDDWYCFDDDKVDPCGSEDIKNLAGGGDYDMSYMCFYKFKEEQ